MNLLPLLAHVIRQDCHYLVYEFMKNGSLQDLLKHVSREKKELEWHVRYNILGIAYGLEYLHINHNPHTIHMDLKSTNILLDLEKKELEWHVRYNILGIAYGLEYLHINHNPHTIHMDLKSTNILLDLNWN
ncbi:Leucine-rich repeat receptor-like serine/threonine/tyrosine-protein kinase SOBIR1 [Linum perenne]